MVKVLVIGSARERGNDARTEFENTARALGRELAAAKLPVIACSLSANTLDRYVLTGMNEVPGRHVVQYFVPQEEFQDGPPQVLTAFKASMPNLHIDTVSVHGGWRPTHVRAIREADVVVAVGGSDRGTGPVIYSAATLEKPVVLVRAFGGAANAAWRDLSGHYSDSDRRTLEAAPTGTWSADLVKLTIDYAKRNPLRTTRVWPAVVMSSATLALTAIALLLIGDVAIAKAGAVAAVFAGLGVILRHAAAFRSLDFKGVSWDLLQAVIIGVALIGVATTLVGIDFFKQLSGDDQVVTLVKFGAIAFLAGIALPNVVAWFTDRAGGAFPVRK